MEDRFSKFDESKKFGRPTKDEAQKKTKKVQLAFTEKDYEKMKKYQEMFNKKTLTATIEFLIDRGEEKVLEDLERVRGR